LEVKRPRSEHRPRAVPLRGAPRIPGELLKLGFEVAQSSVANYMVKRCGPHSPGWSSFLRNHAPDIAAMDLFIAPTIGFDDETLLVIQKQGDSTPMQFIVGHEHHRERQVVEVRHVHSIAWTIRGNQPLINSDMKKNVDQ
jgi:hypothetical protein